MGDFNAEPGSPCYRAFVSENVINGPFCEVFNGEYSSTYHGFSEEFKNNHIDWILYKGRIEPVTKAIIRDKYNDRYPSDHFPVYASFEFFA